MGFGSDAQGQLGGARIDESDSDSSDTDSTSSSSTTSADEVWTPARVPGLCGKGVVALAAGGAANSDAGHTVAVTAAGAVLCLGAGGLGQLGAGVDSSSTPMPVPVRKTAWS
jgi:alpha-tubulin suppressor-like RCC1 family protein